MPDNERYNLGMAIRREVMGDDFVDRALATATEFSRPFQDVVTEYCWGNWGRDGLERKTRSLITVAMLAALGRSQELRGHVRGAKRNGCTDDELRETLIQVAVYTGVPAGVEAFRVANEVLADLSEPRPEQERRG